MIDLLAAPARSDFDQPVMIIFGVRTGVADAAERHQTAEERFTATTNVKGEHQPQYEDFEHHQGIILLIISIIP